MTARARHDRGDRRIDPDADTCGIDPAWLRAAATGLFDSSHPTAAWPRASGRLSSVSWQMTGPQACLTARTACPDPALASRVPVKAEQSRPHQLVLR